MTTETITRELQWLEQRRGQQLNWRQVKAASDGEDKILTADAQPRTTDNVIQIADLPKIPRVVEEKVEVDATNLAPAYTVSAFTIEYDAQTRPIYRYAPDLRAALGEFGDAIFAALEAAVGAKWPITSFHFDVGTRLLQFTRQVTISDVEEERPEECHDKAAIAVATKAAKGLANLLTEAHGHDIVCAVAEEPA